MKAKYYPDTNFLNAEMGNSSSYVWTRIMAAMEVVKTGTRRKIGNELDTKAWTDPWLPNVENDFLTRIMPEQFGDIMVNDFMHSEELK